LPLALFVATAASGAPPEAKDVKIVLAAHRQLSCNDCHGVAQPTAAPPETVCARCHGVNGQSYKGRKADYIDEGRTITADMHQSHLGPVECFRCHANHRPPPEPLFCNTCHQFAVTAK
jgi:hypothetical protein